MGLNRASTRAGIALLLALIAWAPPALSAAPGVCARCNLVFVNLDFLRSNYIGLLTTRGLTPNIDAFFANAVVFENAYATAGSTYRGNLSVFTATDPHFFAIDVINYTQLERGDRHHAWTDLFHSRRTIAEHLESSGYHTVGLNKGRRSGNHTTLDRGFDSYRDYPMRTLIDDILADALAMLPGLSAPYFLHLHAVPTRLHNAYYPRGRTRNPNPDIIYRPYAMNGEDYAYAVYSDYRVSYDRRWRAEHEIYRQQLDYADESLGALLQYLERIRDDSIIVLFSTHGTQIGDNRIFASDGTGYEMNIRVPLLIHNPAIDGPVRVSTPVSMIDLVPTVLDMLDLPAMPGDGISLLPVIRGEPYARDYLWGRNDKDEFVIRERWKLLRHFETDRVLTRRDDNDQGKDAGANHYDEHKDEARRLEFVQSPGFVESRTIEREDWRLEVRERQTNRLYDIAADPFESTDLADEFPDVVAALGKILDEHRAMARRRIGEALGQDGSTPSAAAEH